MTEVNLDEKDFKILQWLDREGDIDVDEVSDELGISTSTVYYRLDKYRKQGILAGTVSKLDARELGLELTVISEIKSDYGPGYDEIGECLTDISGVQTVYFMLGEKSFTVIAHLRDHDHLQEYIDDIIHTDGVEHSSTQIALRTFKDESRLLVNYDDEDLMALIESE
ncbi:AsnC family transcriptional regulator [Haladaptatus sp. R4]|uniref:Lrp/AsnC family transcriptional regulator n=1 Tax=Haladaptatus sp. R4 TaxID=1679489 RepID=UPI0007B49B32|nr:Lrp/AsnC family transcriptional regulator [Haladaptatus sp. R4]KZN24462.1 AsnC family transcriptional regulator [Haladaptatus sp. R4]